MLNQRCILITVLGLALGASHAAFAGPPDRSWQVRGDSANGYAYDNDGCLYRAIDMGGSEEASHERGGRPARETAVWASYWSFDACTGVQTAGMVYDSSATFSGSIHGASATVSIPVDSHRCHFDADHNWVCDYLGSSTVSVTATWSAFGDTFHGINHSIAHTGQSHARYRWNGRTRDATVIIDASMDGTSLPFGYAYGTVGTYKSGGAEQYRHSAH